MRGSIVFTLQLAVLIGGVVLETGSAKAQSGEAAASEEGAVSTPSDKERSEQLAPPIALPTREAAVWKPVNPWFVRPPFVITPDPASEWRLTVYGFAEADMMRDSTRSFSDGVNNNVVAHIQTQADAYARFQTSIRNSRLGFKAEAPRFAGIRSSGVLEFDLFGNQPSVNAGGGSSGQAPGSGDTTEAAYFNNAAFRVRHAYVKIEDQVVDALVGQTYHLLGWQNYFFGASCGFLGLPNELFNRTVQVRLSHAFESGPVNVEVAAAALRGAERDSGLPDLEGGLRLALNHWKGMTTPGSGGTGALPAAIGVSGLIRQFAVDPYAPLPAPPIRLPGWAVAIDIFLPIIPVKDNTDRGNALSLTAEFVTGSGDADQYTGMTAGATMPNVYPLPADTPVNAAGASVPQTPGSAPLVGTPYTPDVDPGMVAFDSNGFLHTINWETFIVGVQYYLPPTGRVFLSGNYSRGNSNNIASLYHPDSPRQPWVNAQAVFRASRYADGNLFVDITPPIRVGVSYQRVDQNFADGTSGHNNRIETTFLYFF
ncbi:MAG TPA: hypothetical protein VHG72_12925 [Polyangia bacterium]|nr:hypothetical protein [Polyangia bacterium]